MRRLETGRADATLVEAGGVRLAVSRVGQGVPVVCLTAIGHGSRDFDAFVERLPAGFEAILVDWPGHGRSEDDAEPASAARYAALLSRLLERLDVRSPILVGNSIGGAAVIRFAASHPVRGLVLCDPGGLVALNAVVRRLCGLFARFFAAGERDAAWFPMAFALYYRIVLPSAAAAAQRRRIVAAARETATVCRQAWESFGRPDADVRAMARELEARVWFAWAKQDRVIPLNICRPAVEAMRHASVTTFRAGHAAFLEQPDAFSEGFRAFAESLTEPQVAEVEAPARRQDQNAWATPTVARATP